MMNSESEKDEYPFHWDGFNSEIPYYSEAHILAISVLNENSSENDWLDALRSLKGYSFFLRYTDDQSNNEQRSRLFPHPHWTFQHHAAYHSAPRSVVEEMIKRKYPLSYRDNHGKLPMDYVQTNSPVDYRELFTPKGLCQKVGLSKLLQMERNMNKVIKERLGRWLKNSEPKSLAIFPMLSVYYEKISYHNSAETAFFSISDLNLNFMFYLEKKYGHEDCNVPFYDDEEGFDEFFDDVKLNPEVVILNMYRLPDYTLGREYKITENSCILLVDHFY